MKTCSIVPFKGLCMAKRGGGCIKIKRTKRGRCGWPHTVTDSVISSEIPPPPHLPSPPSLCLSAVAWQLPVWLVCLFNRPFFNQTVKLLPPFLKQIQGTRRLHQAASAHSLSHKLLLRRKKQRDEKKKKKKKTYCSILQSAQRHADHKLRGSRPERTWDAYDEQNKRSKWPTSGDVKGRHVLKMHFGFYRTNAQPESLVLVGKTVFVGSAVGGAVETFLTEH